MVVEDVDMRLRRHTAQLEAMDPAQRVAARGVSSDLLRAEHYTIYPYARGLWYPPDTLYAVYAAMVADRSLRRVLYAEKYLDLEAFCAYFQGAALYIAVTPDNNTVLGAVWFTGVTEQKSNIGIWAVRRMRGLMAQQMVDRVCTFAFQLYGWRTIWGKTPWTAALYLGLRIGFEHVATVPDATTTARGKTLPLYVVRRNNPLYTEND